MKRIYVASPYSGDIERNTEYAKNACRFVIKQGYAFFCPHLLYPNILQENNPKERQLGLDMGLAMMESCDELWVFGKHISKGMAMEMKRAKEINMPIVYQKFEVTQTAIPTFHSKNFEVKSKQYGNTGGNCMVGTVQFYLPDLDRCLWVNCSDESVLITTADYVWNTDGSESWERYEDVRVADFYLDESPEQWSQWIPMVHEALAYTIEQEVLYFKKPFALSVEWLPEALRANVDDKYLNWLQSERKQISIAEHGRIVMDDTYLQNNPVPSGFPRMVYP